MAFTDLTAVLIGPDVSNVNRKTLDPETLKSQRMGFGIYKVGQGLITGGLTSANFTETGLDKYAKANDLALKSADLPRCRYFFLQRGDGRAQAERFWALTNELGDVQSVGHVVDIEVQDSKGTHPSYQDVTDFLARWRELTTLKLGAYSGRWFWQGYLKNPPWPGFDWLWDGGTYVGNANCTTDPWQVLQSGGSDKQGVTPDYWNAFGGKTAYDLRQYKSTVSIGGICPCDVSVFPGTRSELESLWGIAASPDKTTPVADTATQPTSTFTGRRGSNMMLVRDPKTGRIYLQTSEGNLHWLASTNSVKGYRAVLGPEQNIDSGDLQQFPGYKS